ncbi:MAG: hypothetical protein IPN59_17525 [Holophaga sp.]|nr:hypothetical protein [Holophaga sp.]
MKVSASRDGRAALATIRVMDETGRLLAEFANLELRRATSMTAGSQSGLAGKRSGGGDSTPELSRPGPNSPGMLRHCPAANGSSKFPGGWQPKSKTPSGRLPKG